MNSITWEAFKESIMIMIASDAILISITAAILIASDLRNTLISFFIWLLLVITLMILALFLLLYCVGALINMISCRHCKLMSGKNKP